MFGLSDYWRPEDDIVGCQFDDPELGFVWPAKSVCRSDRDAQSGSYRAMVRLFEHLSQKSPAVAMA